MFTRFFLWLVYTASYLCCFILEVLVLFYKSWNEFSGHSTDNKTNVLSFLRWLPISILTELVIFTCLTILSFIVICLLKNVDFNTKIKINPEDNVTYDASQYVLAQIITVLTLVFSNYGILIGIVIFIIGGIYFVRSKKIHQAPLFVIPLGYKIYNSGDKILIMKGSKDRMRLRLQENIDGIPARELEPGIFLVKD